MLNNLQLFLDAKVIQYNQPNFIENDPIVIPHQFTKKQDIEIMGFFAAILAWGQRKTIINKCQELIVRMDNSPFDYILNHQETDLKALLGFKHRTFNDTDLLYFIVFFKQHYQHYESLEDAFLPSVTGIKKSFVFQKDDLDVSANASFSIEKSLSVYDSRTLVQAEISVETMLNHFRTYFFSLADFPHRTKKHVSSPQQKSTCKRLNMFLRWMVRKDNCGVDFGIWNRINPADLICPCDLHVDRVARKLKLITRKQTDWQTAVELTDHLKNFDLLDPVKYDFALFGLGIEEKF